MPIIALTDAQVLLDRVLQQVPHLTANGLDGRLQYAFEPRQLGEIAACVHWLQRYAHVRRSINRRYTSYGLKHVVENSAEAHDVHHYICNGAFIAAAIGLGFEWRALSGAAALNAQFAMGFIRGAVPAVLTTPSCCRRPIDIPLRVADISVVH